MAKRNVVSWNALLHGYVENGACELALRLFDVLEAEEADSCVLPDSRTYVAALTACAALASSERGECVSSNWLAKGKQIHLRALKNGCCNIYVESTLVDLYAECGGMEEARVVFDGMIRKDVVAWTALLKGYVASGESELALQLFDRMSKSGGRSSPNAWTYVAALTACAALAAEDQDASLSKVRKISRKWLTKGKEIHSQAVMNRCSDSIFVQNTLVDMYARCGSMADSRRVFDQMKRRDVISWNALLQGYAENGEGEVALKLFDGMEDSDSGACVLPDARTFVAALTACATLAETRGRWLEKGKSVHSKAVISRCCDHFVENTLIYMYSKCRSMADAQRVFDEMIQRDVVSWNCLIQGYVDNGNDHLALELTSRMKLEGFELNFATFVAALTACGNLMAVETGRLFHAEIQSSGLDQEVTVANCLVDFYGKCGKMEAAKLIADYLKQKNLITWNCLMAGYGLQGDAISVLEVFERMRERKIAPDEISFTHVLAACSHSGLTEKGKEYFQAMEANYGVTPNIIHFNCVVDLLGRANLLDEAVRFVRTMPAEANSVTWLTVLGACRKWGNVVVGRLAYEELLKLDDAAAGYVLMANIYGDDSGDV